MQAAGLSPVRVDMLPFALVRAVSPVVDAASPLEVIVDIGADTVVVVVHQGGRPRFVRTLAGHGGETITQALMSRYDWTWEEAERTKITVGPARGRRRQARRRRAARRPTSTRRSPGAVRPTHPAQGVIAEHVDALVAELGATLDYYRASTDGEARSHASCSTGLAADLGGLAESLGGGLELPVDLPLGDRPTSHAAAHGAAAARRSRPSRVPTGLCLGTAS